MNIRQAIDQSGYKDVFLAHYLGINDDLFSHKKTNWRGRHFNESEVQRLAKKFGMVVEGGELFPELAIAEVVE